MLGRDRHRFGATAGLGGNIQRIDTGKRVTGAQGIEIDRTDRGARGIK